MSDIAPRVGRDWFAAREIIKKFIRDIQRLEMNEKELDHNAAALIARLAHENLLIVHVDQVKD